MIPVLILASTLASPHTMHRREALEHRLARAQAQIDRTMDLNTVKRLNAEYARLQRELDAIDMRVVRETSAALESR